MENIQSPIFKKIKIAYNNDSIIIYLSFFLVLFMMYRNSWLPGGLMFIGKENFVVLVLSIFFFWLVFDFNKVFSLKFSLKSEYFGLGTLILIGIYSVIYNVSNEFINLYNITRFIAFIFYAFLFFYYLPKLILINNSYFKSITKFYAILGSAVGIIGILMYIVGFVPYSYYTANSRYISVIIHPNQVSLLLTPTTITTLYYFLINKQKFSVYKKIFYIVSVLIQLLSQFLTLCRGGILGTFIGVLLLLFFFYRGKIFILISVFISFVYYFINTIFLSKGNVSNIGRFLLLIPVYNMLVEKNMHTFFGYGVTNAFKAFEDYRAKFDVLEPVNNPHNVILSMFIMFGLIFTIFFLIFFISLLIKGWRYSSRAKERNTKMFYWFLFASTFSIFIQGVTDSAIIMPEYYVMPPFLLSLGLLFLFTRQKNKFTYN